MEKGESFLDLQINPTGLSNFGLLDWTVKSHWVWHLSPGLLGWYLLSAAIRGLWVSSFIWPLNQHAKRLRVSSNAQLASSLDRYGKRTCGALQESFILGRARSESTLCSKRPSIPKQDRRMWYIIIDSTHVLTMRLPNQAVIAGH